MGIEDLTVDDLWQALYDSVPPPLAEGEKTASMIADELGIDDGTARKFIRQWIKDGMVRFVGKRRNGASPFTDAYVVNDLQAK
jgi:Mn-dependent DtxR family transcriptional regulator